MTTVVTPCQHELVPDASQKTWASMWVWPSTKPGRDDVALGVDLSRAPLADAADEGDAVADDADVGPVRAEARPVDHGAVADHQVVRHAAPRTARPGT